MIQGHHFHDYRLVYFIIRINAYMINVVNHALL